jgi:hypothetical protein
MEPRKKEDDFLTRDWVKVNEAASLTGDSPDTIMNKIYKGEISKDYARRSLISKVWWIYKPAVFGFSQQEYERLKIAQ